MRLILLGALIMYCVCGIITVIIDKDNITDKLYWPFALVALIICFIPCTIYTVFIHHVIYPHRSEDFGFNTTKYIEVKCVSERLGLYWRVNKHWRWPYNRYMLYRIVA